MLDTSDVGTCTGVQGTRDAWTHTATLISAEAATQTTTTTGISKRRTWRPSWFETTRTSNVLTVMAYSLQPFEMPAGIRGEVVARAEDFDFQEVGRPNTLNSEEDYLVVDVRGGYYVVDVNSIVPSTRNSGESNCWMRYPQRDPT